MKDIRSNLVELDRSQTLRYMSQLKIDQQLYPRVKRGYILNMYGQSSLTVVTTTGRKLFYSLH